MKLYSEREPECDFGIPWSVHQTPSGCLWCRAETARFREEFQADVAAGVFDAQGYTPADRREQRRARGETK